MKNFSKGKLISMSVVFKVAIAYVKALRIVYFVNVQGNGLKTHVPFITDSF